MRSCTIQMSESKSSGEIHAQYTILEVFCDITVKGVSSENKPGVESDTNRQVFFSI